MRIDELGKCSGPDEVMMYVVLQRSGIYARIRLVEMARIRSLIVLFCSHKAVLLKYSTLMFSFLIM